MKKVWVDADQPSGHSYTALFIRLLCFVVAVSSSLRELGRAVRSNSCCQLAADIKISYLAHNWMNTAVLYQQNFQECLDPSWPSPSAYIGLAWCHEQVHAPISDEILTAPYLAICLCGRTVPPRSTRCPTRRRRRCGGRAGPSGSAARSRTSPSPAHTCTG